MKFELDFIIMQQSLIWKVQQVSIQQKIAKRVDLACLKSNIDNIRYQ